MKVILLAVVVILQMSMASAASKAKKYDWNDSNMDKFGSGKDKKATKASAMSNTAWQGAGQEVGLQIWRIVKSKVTDWDKASYGEFYNGDSYIILNTYTETPESKELKYDIHFWIGKYSTQDEYGAAQYNAVELDTFLDDKAVQHREVQGHESDLFKSYFDVLTLLKGGADTSFQRVVPGEYSPRFFHVKKQGNRRITVTQISMKRSNLNDDDVFILDNGQIIYQINGRSCTGDVKYKAAQEVQKLKSRMGNIRSETVEMRSVRPNHPALKLLDDGESSIGVVAGRLRSPKSAAATQEGEFMINQKDFYKELGFVAIGSFSLAFVCGLIIMYGAFKLWNKAHIDNMALQENWVSMDKESQDLHKQSN